MEKRGKPRFSAVQPWEDIGCLWQFTWAWDTFLAAGGGPGDIRGKEVGAEVPGATWVELHSDLSPVMPSNCLGGTCW